MASISKTLSNLGKLISSSTELKFAKLSKDNTIDMLEDAVANLTNIKQTFKEISPKTSDAIMSAVYDKLKYDKAIRKNLDKVAINFLTNYRRSLKGKALKGNFITNTIAVCESMIPATQLILDKIDDFFDSQGSEILFKNVKISHASILGMIFAIDIFSKYTSYILAAITAVNTGSTDTFKRYMGKYLVEHRDLYFEIVNDSLNSKNKFNLFKKLTTLENKGLDLKLVGQEGADSAAMSKFIGDIIGVDNLLLYVVESMINAIALFGESYIDMRHEYYESISERKKWMEAQITLLNLEIEEATTTEEKIRLRKIVEYYDNKIAQYDKKLSKYFDK